MPAMSKDTRERVFTERVQLLDRIEKLRVYIEEDIRFKTLRTISQKLLKEQLYYMDQYADILLMRLELDDIERASEEVSNG